MEEQMMHQEPSAMDESMAAEIDRRVREEIARARTQWEADMAQADVERERLASMTEDERARYALSRREAALAEREKLLVERELRAMAAEQLAGRGLPRELADVLPCDAEDRCLAAIDTLEHAFRAAVQSAVDQRLRGRIPAAGSARRVDMENMTDEEYYRANVK